MEYTIRIRDFPNFIRFEIEEGFREKIFTKALEEAGNTILDIAWRDFWYLAEKRFGEEKYTILFGKGGGRIIELLMEDHLTVKEILGRNGHLTPSTIYRSIKKLKEERIVSNESEKLGLNPAALKKVRVSYMAKVKDGLGREGRRKHGVSKNNVELAIYLWGGYEKVRAEEGLDTQYLRYGRTYPTPLSLAAAVKRWKKGMEDIPKWALISIADLTRFNTGLDEEGVVLNYHSPPGIRVIPYYNDEYKIPIKADLDLDSVAIKLIMKSSGNGRYYKFRDKDRLFEELHRSFGSFKSTGIPSAVKEIIRRYYEIEYFDRSAIRIPTKIKRRWGRITEDERILSKSFIMETVFGLACRYDGHYELTSRSKDFLKDVSDILEELGRGKLNIKKRPDRPHYRCLISSKKIESLSFINTPEDVYPDFEVWRRIPLNNIRGRIGEKLSAKDLENAVEESCREELRDYVNHILESIDGDSGKWNGIGEEVSEYFWKNRRIPIRWTVRDYLKSQNLVRIS